MAWSGRAHGRPPLLGLHGHLGEVQRAVAEGVLHRQAAAGGGIVEDQVRSVEGGSFLCGV